MQKLRTKAAARWEATGPAHLASAVVHAVGARLLSRVESDASAAAEVIVAVVRVTGLLPGPYSMAAALWVSWQIDLQSIAVLPVVDSSLFVSYPTLLHPGHSASTKSSPGLEHFSL